MSQPFDKIVKYWKSSYGETIDDSNRLDIPAHFEKMAALMAPGKSFYYVANFHTLELEHVSDSVQDFIGEPPADATMDKLLALALPTEIEKIYRKEQVIKNFFEDHLKTEQLMDYKISYTYKCKSFDGRKRAMLHQASILSVNDAGQFVHVFSIHSDISHLNAALTEDVSFLNINGGKSYYNVNTDATVFNPETLKPTKRLEESLTDREIEVIEKMARGETETEIAEALNLSIHTIRTHKKNALGKVDCKNSVHLVTLCIAEGLIIP